MWQDAYGIRWAEENGVLYIQGGGKREPFLLPPFAGKDVYKRQAQAEVDKGKEYILRDAPALVVAIGSKKDIHRTHDSGHSCLSYAELYAPTLGLGTCWAGFFEHAGEAEYKPLLDLLGVPEDKIIAGGILMGYPKVRYRNIVERQPLDVTFDTEE